MVPCLPPSTSLTFARSSCIEYPNDAAGRPGPLPPSPPPSRPGSSSGVADATRAGMGCICMYTPSASGGHALYTWELMTALTLHADAETRFELVTSENLAPEFKDASYPVHT